jgi:pullulanase
MGNDSQPGYLGNAGGYASNVKHCFYGAPTWCNSPTQSINYASCHDNLALFDKITLSSAKSTPEERVKMNNLSAAIVMTSQGVPFFQAGEEILRSKPNGSGGYDHNSYKSPDSINSIKWDTLNDATYADSYAYYKGLIAFRKAHPILRLTTPEEVTASISSLPDLASNVNAFLLKGGDIDDDLVVIFNPRKETTTVNLPEGKWNVYVEGNTAGTNVLRSVEGSVTVDAISAMVLVQEKEVPATVNLWLIIGLAAAAVVVVGAVVTVILVKRKK